MRQIRQEFRDEIETGRLKFNESRNRSWPGQLTLIWAYFECGGGGSTKRRIQLDNFKTTGHQ